MGSSTQSAEYTERLQQLESIWWKKLVPVQAPYRWHLRSLKLGFVLDVGCGIGRNLGHIDDLGVGVDHNAESINAARRLGFKAFTPDEFMDSQWSKGSQFDSILLSHIVEHLDRATSRKMVQSYLPYLKKGGRVVILCPQEAGYRSDATHVEFMNFSALQNLCNELELSVEKSYSFPFPRWVGKFFKYNEFVVIAQK
jgi:SAM-dependent methyltransferase